MRRHDDAGTDNGQSIMSKHLADTVLLLDGSMGRELRLRGVEIPETIWSANALIVAPDVVVDVHEDNIRAGADAITTNSYGVIRADLARIGLEHRYAELNELACELAQRARDRAGKADVLIAGSLPPLRGSYRPDLVGAYDEILPLYREQAELLARHVDVLLCETMSSASEARAAAVAACATGLPVWLSWSLHDEIPGALRSGESIADAHAAVADLPIEGFLANCCPPESVAAAVPILKSFGARFCGGYANTFRPIPPGWRLDGDREEDGLLAVREDLNADTYAEHALGWVAAGANIVGGCCGASPDFIARIRERLP